MDILAGGARAALRAATDAAHLRLHALPAFAALAEGRIALPAYAALLRRTLGFHAALEARLTEAPSPAGHGVEPAARRRAHLLRADLAWLDAAGPPVELAPLPPLASAAEALGALYVAEGSTLGGRQLARALDALLPPGPDGRRFLLGHGEAHGEMWRSLCVAIERCGASADGLAGMVSGAIATFAAFESWFTAPSPVNGGGPGWGEARGAP